MNPLCPINQIGIRHPVMCSDGYMYEEKCLQGWMKNNATSPINRTLIEFVKPCDKNDKCLNSFEGNIEEDYERSNFTFTLNGNIVEFYDKILYLETTQPGDFVIFNRNLMMDLVKINEYALQYASDELKDDKEIVLASIKNEPFTLFNASERLQNDKELNIEVVKMKGILIFHLLDELQKDEDIINTAVKSIERDIREALIEEDRRLYWTLRSVNYEER